MIIEQRNTANQKAVLRSAGRCCPGLGVQFFGYWVKRIDAAAV